MTMRELLLFVLLGGTFSLAAGVGTSLACRSMATRVGSPHAVLVFKPTY